MNGSQVLAMSKLPLSRPSSLSRPVSLLVRRGRYLGLLAGLVTCGVMACEPVSNPANLEDGVYCLTADVSLDVGTIRLRDNATLDCQGHRISDLQGRTSYGVLGRGDNITLKNCIFDGFDIAVNFSSVTNYRIENNVSVNARFSGINANGDQGLVSGNTVRSPASAYSWAAIGASGVVDVTGNTVILGKYTPTVPTVPRGGIEVRDSAGGVVAHNVVRVTANVDETGTSIAGTRADAIIYRNILVTTPGSQRVALACNGSFALQNESVGFGLPDVNCEVP